MVSLRRSGYLSGAFGVLLPPKRCNSKVARFWQSLYEKVFKLSASQGVTRTWSLMSKPSNVIYLHQFDPQAALERLNRITGLRFSRWPQSLVPVVQDAAGVVETRVDKCAAVAEPLSYVARP
jgi:hypothetical protein